MNYQSYENAQDTMVKSFLKALQIGNYIHLVFSTFKTDYVFWHLAQKNMADFEKYQFQL